MTPTGSWPTVSPRATGYSPFRIWTSVPQIVVVVTLISASVGPTRGTGFPAAAIRPGSTETAAFIFFIIPPSIRLLSLVLSPEEPDRWLANRRSRVQNCHSERLQNQDHIQKQNHARAGYRRRLSQPAVSKTPHDIRAP